MVLTFFFAQFLGLVLMILAASMLTQRQMYLQMVAAFKENRSSLFGVSFMGLVVGIVIVFTHNVWSGGILRVLVTVMGWAIFLKSAAFLVLPTNLLSAWMRPLTSRRIFVIAGILLLLVGIYLFLTGSGGR